MKVMGWELFLAAGRADEAFVARQLVSLRGGTINVATQEEDAQDHVDFWWHKPDGTIVGIDVKGMRKRSRNDFRPNNDITWLEFQNVLGTRGWLYGEAKYIAFRRIGLTVFVDRAVLASYAERLVAGKPIVDVRPLVCGIPYTRRKWGRNDITVMVPLDDVQRLAEFILPNE